MGSNGIAIASAILLFSLCFQVKKADPNNLLQKNETTTEEEDQGFETEPDFDMKFLVLETSSQPDSKSPDSETGFGIGEGFPVVESTTKVGGVFGEEFVEGEGGQTIPRRFLKGGGHGGGRGGSGGGRGGGRGTGEGGGGGRVFPIIVGGAAGSHGHSNAACKGLSNPYSALAVCGFLLAWIFNSMTY